MTFGKNSLKVLAATMRNPDEGHYALELVKSAKVGVGSIYATLAQLQQYGLLSSGLEEIDPVLAGRPPRRYYRLTVKGIEVARRELLAAQRALSFGGEYA